jgi:hypothetical protein
MSGARTADGVRYVQLGKWPPGVAPRPGPGPAAPGGACRDEPGGEVLEQDPARDGAAPSRRARLVALLAGAGRILRPRGPWLPLAATALLLSAFALRSAGDSSPPPPAAALAAPSPAVASPNDARVRATEAPVPATDGARAAGAVDSNAAPAERDADALALAHRLVALRTQLAGSERPGRAFPPGNRPRAPARIAPAAAAPASTPGPAPAPMRASAARPIPDEIESDRQSAGADPLADLDVAAALRWIDPSIAPFAVRSVQAGPGGLRARLLGTRDDGERGHGFAAGDTILDGWTVVAVSEREVTLVSPRGNPVRLAVPAHTEAAVGGGLALP